MPTTSDAIREHFTSRCNGANANMIARLINGYYHADKYASVQKRMKECFNPPPEYDKVMTAINEELSWCAFGVQGIPEHHILYINTGDTYTPTVVYDIEKDQYFLTSWGDYVERMESAERS